MPRAQDRVRSERLAALMPWSDKLDDPIILPNGKKLVTLKDAIDHLGETVLKFGHDHPKVLTAAT
jgi:hypothetical protein